MWKKFSEQKEKGVVLYMALVVMALLLSMVLGLGSIFVGQLTILRGVGHSVIALYAADAGGEKVLYDANNGVDIVANCVNPGDCTGILANGAMYEVVAEAPGGNCVGLVYCIESSGTFVNSTRRIFIDR